MATPMRLFLPPGPPFNPLGFPYRFVAFDGIRWDKMFARPAPTFITRVNVSPVQPLPEGSAMF